MKNKINKKVNENPDFVYSILAHLLRYGYINKGEKNVLSFRYFCIKPYAV